MLKAVFPGEKSLVWRLESGNARQRQVESWDCFDVNDMLNARSASYVSIKALPTKRIRPKIPIRRFIKKGKQFFYQIPG